MQFLFFTVQLGISIIQKLKQQQQQVMVVAVMVMVMAVRFADGILNI